MTTGLQLRRLAGWCLRRILMAAARNKLPVRPRVLMYHSIDNSGSTISISPAEFREHMQLLYDGGWRSLSATEFLTRISGPPQPSREVLITFDDAYDNFYEHAAPVLANFGFRATVFVPADFIESAPGWFARDRPRIRAFLARFGFSPAELRCMDALMELAAGQRLMSVTQMRELKRSGFDFENHTAGHHFLPSLAPEELNRDFMRARAVLADAVGPVEGLLAYPYGVCNDAVVRAASEAGFSAAFTAESTGAASGDRFRIGRIGVNGNLGIQHLRFALCPAADTFASLRTRLARRGASRGVPDA